MLVDQQKEGEKRNAVRFKGDKTSPLVALFGIRDNEWPFSGNSWALRIEKDNEPWKNVEDTFPPYQSALFFSTFGLHLQKFILLSTSPNIFLFAQAFRIYATLFLFFIR